MAYTRGYPGAGLPVQRSFICRNGHVRIEADEARIITAAGEQTVSFAKTDALRMETLDFIEGVRQGRNVDDTADAAQYALEIAERAQRMVPGKTSWR